MKNNISENTVDNGNPANRYFIKPFGIVSSYHSFIDIWKVANKIYGEIEEVSDAHLMQSLSGVSKYGYVSYSRWITKESFLKYNLNNTVLKYHNVLSSNGSKSVAHYLYKIIHEENWSGKIKRNNILQIFFFESDLTENGEILKYWKNLCNIQNKGGGLKTSCLFKAIFKKSKFGYVGILYMKDSRTGKDNMRYISASGNTDIRKSKTKENGYTAYSSVYKIVKNIKKN